MTKKQKAHALVSAAVERGDLVPQPCEVCGKIKHIGVNRMHAHHDDYDKPLDVRWFCSSHHHEAHGKTARHQPRRIEGYNPEKTVFIKPLARTTVERRYPKRTKWPKWWVNPSENLDSLQ
jgi:hypothetical protein